MDAVALALGTSANAWTGVCGISQCEMKTRNGSVAAQTDSSIIGQRMGVVAASEDSGGMVVESVMAVMMMMVVVIHQSEEVCA